MVTNNSKSLDPVLLQDVSFIRNRFKRYYQSNFVNSVVDIKSREFGIGDYGKKISKRHMYFRYEDDLNFYLRNNTPFFISYSVGYYNYPDRRPMDNKEWTGADIVYEFDSDDFDLPCQQEHDIWVCKNENCKSSGKGHTNVCPECNSPTKIFEWTCNECLGVAKKETIRLNNFLEDEFKLDPNSFVISFSGSKGYHIRVCDETIIPLSKSARLQLMTYILGNDLDLKQLGFETKGKGKMITCPNPEESKGWSKKITAYIIDILTNLDVNELKKELNITISKAKLLLDNKDHILNKMYNNMLWGSFNGSSKLWETVINKAISKFSFKIDPSSSSDIYKIMRVPNTIHGGSGFLSSKIENIDALKEFDAFKDPVVLDTTQYRKIKIINPTPKFNLFGETYGPFSIGEELELSEAVSIFLILKGIAL